MATAIKPTMLKTQEFESLRYAFLKMDRQAIKELAQIISGSYRSSNR